jgi:hypothetical protein
MFRTLVIQDVTTHKLKQQKINNYDNQGHNNFIPCLFYPLLKQQKIYNYDNQGHMRLKNNRQNKMHLSITKMASAGWNWVLLHFPVVHKLFINSILVFWQTRQFHFKYDFLWVFFTAKFCVVVLLVYYGSVIIIIIPLKIF